jgi:hypothetical protein
VELVPFPFLAFFEFFRNLLGFRFSALGFYDEPETESLKPKA